VLATSTLHADLHEQDSEMMDSHLLVIFGISSCLYNKAEINPNKYIVYIIFANKIKYTIILISKYNIKLLIEKYK